MNFYFFIFFIIWILCIYCFYINNNYIKKGLTTVEIEIFYNNLKEYQNNWKNNIIKLFGNEHLKMLLPLIRIKLK